MRALEHSFTSAGRLGHTDSFNMSLSGGAFCRGIALSRKVAEKVVLGKEHRALKTVPWPFRCVMEDSRRANLLARVNAFEDLLSVPGLCLEIYTHCDARTALCRVSHSVRDQVRASSFLIIATQSLSTDPCSKTLVLQIIQIFTQFHCYLPRHRSSDA
jgi:hypothetical protein